MAYVTLVMGHSIRIRSQCKLYKGNDLNNQLVTLSSTMPLSVESALFLTLADTFQTC